MASPTEDRPGAGGVTPLRPAARATEPDDLGALVERLRDLVLAVPHVTALHGGVFGEAATYLPGRRVAGIRLRDDRLEVHVVVGLEAPVRETALAVRDAVAPFVDRPIHVTVGDVAPSDAPARTPASTPAPAKE